MWIGLVVKRFIVQRRIKSGFFIRFRNPQAGRELTDNQNDEGTDGRPHNREAKTGQLSANGRTFSQAVDGRIRKHSRQNRPEETTGTMDAESVEESS